ncbi:hypothetical protein HU200_062142 [Digitaria exilis]|uniref:Peptidyl-prolyl cis-trans isomerase n=1 Tax=Digitaria exilis TaxID=1010633 RepID=A0A835A435_9POAL|nr:hypothetical protein HU200_062142 [Digitaria exilis]
MELFMNEAPYMVENFHALYIDQCIDSQGRKLHFKNTIIHRVIPNCICHGGDFECGNDTDGSSICANMFPDVEDTRTRKHLTRSLTTHTRCQDFQRKSPQLGHYCAGAPYPYTCGS